jgi:hypothetical protein
VLARRRYAIHSWCFTAGREASGAAVLALTRCRETADCRLTLRVTGTGLAIRALAEALGARDGLAQAVQVALAVVEPGGPLTAAPG